MLTACASAGARPSPASDADLIAASEPIVEVQYRTQLLCPDELDRPLPPNPGPVPAGAEVTHNDAGGAWLDAKIERGEAAERALSDASESCREWQRLMGADDSNERPAGRGGIE